MLADTIAVQLNIDVEKKQQVLEALDVKKRIALLNGFIFEENQILRLERKLSEQVQENVKQNQKEYYLRGADESYPERTGIRGGSCRRGLRVAGKT